MGLELWCWKSFCQGASIEGNTLSSNPCILSCGYVLTSFQPVAAFYNVFFLPAWLHGTELWCWKSTCEGMSVEGNTLGSVPHYLWLCSHKLSTSCCILQCFFCRHGFMGLSCDAGNPFVRVRALRVIHSALCPSSCVTFSQAFIQSPRCILCWLVDFTVTLSLIPVTEWM